jgi:hypothetical protein
VDAAVPHDEEAEVTADLISVDPGVKHSGFAFWHRGDLVGAFLVPADTPMPNHFPDVPCEIVIELPQVYRERRKQKGDQNDLVNLAFAAGRIAGALGLPVTCYRPHDWKGSVPKDVMVERVRSCLSPEELSKMDLPAPSLRHNVFDAVGIGLHHLKRRRVR